MISSLIIGLIFGVCLTIISKKWKLHYALLSIWPPSLFCYMLESQYRLKRETNEHHGIIIAAPNWLYKLSVYNGGASTLLTTFRDPKKLVPHHLYLCKKPEEAMTVINDKNITHVWIFGHGLRHGLDFGKEFLYYCQLESAPRKKFIGQYHCNSMGGMSLVDYNNPSAYDITQSNRRPRENKKSIVSKLEALGFAPVIFSLNLNSLVIFFETIICWMSRKSQI